MAWRRPRLFRVRLVRLVAFTGVLFVLVVCMFKLFENRLVFPGTKFADGWQAPGKEDRIVDVSFTTADGTSIHSWWLPHGDNIDRAVLLCHGNGGNLSHRLKLMRDVAAHLDCGVLQFDYPGYGKSSGSASEDGCYAAGGAALAWLKTEKHVPADGVILLGESLGGAVAVELARRHGCRSIILVDTFTSLPAAAKSNLWFLPCHTFMCNRFDTISKIGGLSCPIVITHGTEDRIVPFSQGELLYAAAPTPKRFIRRDGARHCDNLDDRTWNEIAAFIR